jgi:hypothetical protein
MPGAWSCSKLVLTDAPDDSDSHDEADVRFSVRVLCMVPVVQTSASLLLHTLLLFRNEMDLPMMVRPSALC